VRGNSIVAADLTGLEKPVRSRGLFDNLWYNISESIFLRQSPVGESRLHAVRSVPEPSLQGAGFFYVERILAVIPVPRIPGNVIQVH
jgi:hypothetical protein